MSGMWEWSVSRINPAVIVAVSHGDELILTKYAGREYKKYALIAGFAEFGETIEQTVQKGSHGRSRDTGKESAVL